MTVSVAYKLADAVRTNHVIWMIHTENYRGMRLNEQLFIQYLNLLELDSSKCKQTDDH